MKKLLSAITFAASSLVFSAFAYADVAEISDVSVAAVQAFVAAKAPNVVIVDANNDDARKDVGTVPGAVLLSSYNQYALTELPKDKTKTLVFYCYNSYCQASHAAAQRAIEAGYKDSRVMKAGIVGWNAANKKS